MNERTNERTNERINERMNEFPLVSVLRDVSIVRLTLVSCGRSPFLCRGGDIQSVTLESLSGKHILYTVHSLSPKGRRSGRKVVSV